METTFEDLQSVFEFFILNLEEGQSPDAYQRKALDCLNSEAFQSQFIEGAMTMKFLCHNIVPVTTLSSEPSSSNMDLDEPETSFPSSSNLKWIDGLQPANKANRFARLLKHADTDPNLHQDHEEDMLVDEEETEAAKERRLLRENQLQAEARICSKKLMRSQNVSASKKGELKAEWWSTNRKEVPQTTVQRKVKSKRQQDRIAIKELSQDDQEAIKDPKKLKVARAWQLRVSAIEAQRGQAIESEEQNEVASDQEEGEEEWHAQAGLDWEVDDLIEEEGEEAVEADSGDEDADEERTRDEQKSEKATSDPKEWKGKRNITAVYPVEVHARIFKASLRGFRDAKSPQAKKHKKPLETVTRLAFLCQQLSLPVLQHCMNRHLDWCLANSSSSLDRYASSSRLKALILSFCVLLTEPQTSSLDLTVDEIRGHHRTSPDFRKWFINKQTDSVDEGALEASLSRASSTVLTRMGKRKNIDPVQLLVLDEVLLEGSFPSIPYLGGPSQWWEDTATKLASCITTAAKEDLQKCIERHINQRLASVISSQKSGYVEIKKSLLHLRNVVQGLVHCTNFDVSSFQSDLQLDQDVALSRIGNVLKLHCGKDYEESKIAEASQTVLKLLLEVLHWRDQCTGATVKRGYNVKTVLAEEPLQMFRWRCSMLKEQHGHDRSIIVSCWMQF